MHTTSTSFCNYPHDRGHPYVELLHISSPIKHQHTQNVFNKCIFRRKTTTTNNNNNNTND